MRMPLLLPHIEVQSLRVRSSYVDQLRNRHVVQQALIPVLCDLLDIGKAGKKPSKLDLWELDAFYIERMQYILYSLVTF